MTKPAIQQAKPDLFPVPSGTGAMVEATYAGLIAVERNAEIVCEYIGWTNKNRLTICGTTFRPGWLVCHAVQANFDDRETTLSLAETAYAASPKYRKTFPANPFRCRLVIERSNAG